MLFGRKRFARGTLLLSEGLNTLFLMVTFE
jgi:hypothetical protein